MEAYAGKQFVGIDLHRRRTVIVATTEGGDVLETVRIAGDFEWLTSVMALRLWTEPLAWWVPSEDGAAAHPVFRCGG